MIEPKAGALGLPNPIPAKQGLKPKKFVTNMAGKETPKPDSSKTRIETLIERRQNGEVVKLPNPIPAKQGLKLTDEAGEEYPTKTSQTRFQQNKD